MPRSETIRAIAAELNDLLEQQIKVLGSEPGSLAKLTPSDKDAYFERNRRILGLATKLEELGPR